MNCAAIIAAFVLLLVSVALLVGCDISPKGTGSVVPSNVLRRSRESEQALQEAILEDEWLLHCAGNAEQYVGSFDVWWRLSKFHESVQDRFKGLRPNDPLPGKSEIGKMVRKLREHNRVDIVGNELVRRVE